MTTRTLAEIYRHFARDETATTPVVYADVARAISESDEALDAIGRAPARKRSPAIILAALYDLVLANRAPDLAEAITAADPDAAGREAFHALLRWTDVVVATVTRQQLRTTEPGQGAVLYPAVVAAAHRAGAGAVGLVDLRCGVGLNLQVDRVGITYSNGQTLGDPSSGVQLSSTVVGPRAVPTRAIPDVVSRIGLDRVPFDVTDGENARWVRACLGPGQPQALAALDAQLTLVTQTPSHLLAGDVVASLPVAIAAVPAEALPIVTTTWALSALTPQRRHSFLRCLEDAAEGRAVAWVSVEGVGVAPAVPALGDRHASGHSIVGLWVSDGSTPYAEALGRCWSRGRSLAWLGDA